MIARLRSARPARARTVGGVEVRSKEVWAVSAASSSCRRERWVCRRACGGILMRSFDDLVAGLIGFDGFGLGRFGSTELFSLAFRSDLPSSGLAGWSERVIIRR